MISRCIEVVLCRPDEPRDELGLFYVVGSTSLAQRYFEALRGCERAGLGIIDADRFHNFPHCPRDRAWIAHELNRQIDTINAVAPGTIPLRAEPDMSQELMNRLHLYFEQLRGGVLAPGAFYQAAPAEVQAALRRYNLLIHRYEDRLRHDARGTRRAAAHAVLTFDERRPRYALDEADYLLFSRRNVFGDWLINYCELGKPILDAIQDRDEHVGADNIRPLRYYSADALLRFSGTTPLRNWFAEELRLMAWWHSDEAKPLRALGFEPNDPKNAMGHLTVATLDRDAGAVAGLGEEAIVDLVGHYQCFARVVTHG